MYITKNDKIALIIRGHIRNSFENTKLYELVKKFIEEYNVDVYLYTFKMKDAGKIYGTNTTTNNDAVTEYMIFEYFRDIGPYIKRVILDPIGTASAIGDTFVAEVSKNKFLHMWKSIYNAVKCVRDSGVEYTYVVNIRFDYFNLVKSIEADKSSKELKKLSCLGFFENFIEKIDLTMPITLSNIDCDGLFKDGNVFKSTALDFFHKKRKYEKTSFLSKLNCDMNDILYGIDNVFGGQMQSMYELAYLFVYRMDFIFEFLGKIFPDIYNVTRPAGPPHEAILPIFIKNHMDQFIQCNVIIDYANLPRLRNYKNLILRKQLLISILAGYKNLCFNDIIENYDYDRAIFIFTKFIDFLSKYTFESYAEIGCGYGLFYAIINDLFYDKIKKSTCYEGFYSPVIEYCMIESKCKFVQIETIGDLFNESAELVFINEYTDYFRLLNNMEYMTHVKILALNRMFHTELQHWTNFQNSKYDEFDFVNIIDENGLGIMLAIRKT